MRETQFGNRVLWSPPRRICIRGAGCLLGAWLRGNRNLWLRSCFSCVSPHRCAFRSVVVWIFQHVHISWQSFLGIRNGWMQFKITISGRLLLDAFRAVIVAHNRKTSCFVFSALSRCGYLCFLSVLLGWLAVEGWRIRALVVDLAQY